MKHVTTLIATLGLLAGSEARGGLYTFSQTVNAAIPDANPTGLNSIISVSGLTGLKVFDVNVVLDVAGTWNGDLYAYLTHGSSGYAVLVSRVGRTSVSPYGYGDTGFSITLDDLGLLDIHSVDGSGGLVSGTYQPDGRDVNPQYVLDTSPRTALLSSFNSQDPNGAWTLFFADMASGEQHTLNSWSLQLTAEVPEPVNVALVVFGGLFAAGALWRRWQIGRAQVRAPLSKINEEPRS